MKKKSAIAAGKTVGKKVAASKRLGVGGPSAGAGGGKAPKS